MEELQMRDNIDYPHWTEGNPEWAFNKETVSQLTSMCDQLRAIDYKVELGIMFNTQPDDKMGLEKYQDCMDGLILTADSDPDPNGFQKRVVIQTDANNDSMMLQAGFNDKNKDMWNKGLYYSATYSKDELGKFSSLWDNINENFVKNTTIMPITSTRRIEKESDIALTEFIATGLKSGYVKRVR